MTDRTAESVGGELGAARRWGNAARAAELEAELEALRLHALERRVEEARRRERIALCAACRAERGGKVLLHSLLHTCGEM